MPITDLPTSSADIKVGHRDSVVISCFYEWPRPQSLKALAEAQRKVCDRFGKVVTLSVIPSAELQQIRNRSVPANPPPEERDASIRATAAASDEMSSHTIASAMVILTTGLVGVAVRTFMAGASLLSRTQSPLQTFRSIDEAVKWLESVPGVPGPFPNLAKEVDTWLRS